MLFPRGAALAALLLALALPANDSRAAGWQDGDAAQTEADDQADLFFARFYDRDFKGALKAADRLSKIADNPEGKGIVAAMRAAALLGLERKSDAEKLFAEADRLGANAPEISAIEYDAGLIANDLDVALRALDRMIARFPDQVRKLKLDPVFWVLRHGREADKARNDDRTLALAQLGFGGEAYGDGFAQGAIGTLLKRGDVQAASDLLRYVDDPQIIEDMLVQRRYSVLWPILEERAGPRLEKVRASAVAAAEREYASDPQNSEKLQQLANALRHAGRHEQAIGLRAKLPQTPEAMAAGDDDIGWAVNNIALALHEVGRSEEADQLFATLNDAPMEEGRGQWRVSMIINRLELLVSAGKFEQASKLLDRTELSARNDGSPYARQLVRRLRYCTMAGLGRKDEAEKLLPELLKHAKDARHATVDALLCAGEIDRAEALVLAELEDEDFQHQLVRVLQPVPLTSDDPSIWHGKWHELRGRPRISAAYERLGRDMPAAFIVPPPSLAAR